LCKLDRKHGAWQELGQKDLSFSRDLLPVVDVGVDDQAALIRAGINVINKGTTGAVHCYGSVTMGRSSSRQFVDLRVARLCLRVIYAVDEATRWAVFAGDNAELAKHIRAQVAACLASFAALGAFENDNFVVECDAGMRKRVVGAGQGFAIFVAFQPLTSTESLAFTIHQTVAGSRVTSTAFAPA
jgi:phage tail sheath protein FI